MRSASRRGACRRKLAAAERRCCNQHDAGVCGGERDHRGLDAAKAWAATWGGARPVLSGSAPVTRANYKNRAAAAARRRAARRRSLSCLVQRRASRGCALEAYPSPAAKRLGLRIAGSKPGAALPTTPAPPAASAAARRHGSAAGARSAARHHPRVAAAAREARWRARLRAPVDLEAGNCRPRPSPPRLAEARRVEPVGERALGTPSSSAAGRRHEAVGSSAAIFLLQRKLLNPANRRRRRGSVGGPCSCGAGAMVSSASVVPGWKFDSSCRSHQNARPPAPGGSGQRRNQPRHPLPAPCCTTGPTTSCSILATRSARRSRRARRPSRWRGSRRRRAVNAVQGDRAGRQRVDAPPCRAAAPIPLHH